MYWRLLFTVSTKTHLIWFLTLKMSEALTTPSLKVPDSEAALLAKH